MREVIRQKIADALVEDFPTLTRRDARISGPLHKVHAVIGIRRSGKSCFLRQCLQDRLQAGAPRESLLYFSFEDDRLAGMKTPQLSWLLEEYYLQQPEFRDRHRVAFFLDEIQEVQGWELFIRRILDTEKIDIFVSGSSAKLLSREVATSLRGRSTETIITPFSFREVLRDQSYEPGENPGFLPKAKQSRLQRAFADYLIAGGFPEGQALTVPERITLLQGYVNTCIFRDVVERHAITNVTALHRLVRQLLAAPGGRFSVNKFYNDLRSQGVPVAKDALHAMLTHLEDAFLVRLVPFATDSERQRQVNPRKAYPVDPGLISAFDRSGKPNTGHALETAVLCELERRGFTLSYLITPQGFEVDFLAQPPSGLPWLIQVASDLSERQTREREFRALVDSMKTTPHAKALLLTMTRSDQSQARAEAPKGVSVECAWEWMLESQE